MTKIATTKSCVCFRWHVQWFKFAILIILIIAIIPTHGFVEQEEGVVIPRTSWERKLIPTRYNYTYTESNKENVGIVGFLRRNLVGSNCVLIERGTVSRYYTCIGCSIELAVGCVNDLRNNASFNVAPNCYINRGMEVFETDECCPRITTERSGVKNLAYIGSAYPMALQCIQNVGCQSSSIFNQLVDECLAVCPKGPKGENTDQGGTKSSCFAHFNAVPRRWTAVATWPLVVSSMVGVVSILWTT